MEESVQCVVGKQSRPVSQAQITPAQPPGELCMHTDSAQAPTAASAQILEDSIKAI